jgi:hypothetical protein
MEEQANINENKGPKWIGWLKKSGVLVFLFFLCKGLIWLALAGMVWLGLNK